MIKSQVLTGGRMKAGGVKFADTPEEAEAHARDILQLEIGGHMPKGVLVDPKAEVKQEYYAGVVWDGTRKQPMMLFSDMGGIDIEEVAEKHPDHVGRGHFSNLLPFSDFQAKQVIASVGRHGLRAQPARPRSWRALARLFSERDMTLAEINPLAELEDGSFVALDAHMEMENEARPRQKALLEELGIADEETARGPRAERVRGERRGDRRRRPPRRDPGQGHRLPRQPRPRDRRRRRLADAHRRRALPGRQARELLGDRRQPVGGQGLRPGQGGPARRTASRRSR